MLWNATSLNNKEDEFSYFINNNNIDIALITETWLNPLTKVNFTNYDIIRMDSPRIIAGGVAIVIDKQIKYSFLPQIDFAGCNILLIKIQSGLNLTVGIIYAPPGVQFDFDLLKNFCNDYSPFVLAGDFNAKHRSWNNFSNNTRGVQLHNFIQNNDISIVHSNTYSHITPRRKPSNIDLFLVKDVSYNSICYTINDLSSNHLPVILKFDQVNISKNNLVLNKTAGVF